MIPLIIRGKDGISFRLCVVEATTNNDIPATTLKDVRDCVDNECDEDFIPSENYVFVYYEGDTGDNTTNNNSNGRSNTTQIYISKRDELHTIASEFVSKKLSIVAKRLRTSTAAAAATTTTTNTDEGVNNDSSQLPESSDEKTNDTIVTDNKRQCTTTTNNSHQRRKKRKASNSTNIKQEDIEVIEIIDDDDDDETPTLPTSNPVVDRSPPLPTSNPDVSVSPSQAPAPALPTSSDLVPPSPAASSLSSTLNATQPNKSAKVKQEEAKKKLKVARETARCKYANRYLLHRKSSSAGVGRLGGGLVDTFAKPRKWHPNIWINEIGDPMPDFPFPKHFRDAEERNCHDMDDFYVLNYNTSWQVNGPKFACQPTAAVDALPDYALNNPNLSFPVFMKRTLTSRENSREGKLLGWEYVGNYKSISDPDIVVWESAARFTEASKRAIAEGYYNSSLGATGSGYGRRTLDAWRAKLIEELDGDPSPAGPDYLIEGRVATREELEAKTAPLAARARALKFKPNMNDKDLADLLVELDEFHRQKCIQFDHYNEDIYEYCCKGREGRTTRDSNGRMAGSPAKAATAKAWYDFADQHMLMD